MHDFHIAQFILDGSLKKAKEHGAIKINRIKLKVGLLKMVSPDSLQNAFDTIAHETIASQAKLDVETVPGEELSIVNIEIER
jgi:Zn finger protein HypA/HybF involved in hydrogenase expression